MDENTTPTSTQVGAGDPNDTNVKSNAKKTSVNESMYVDADLTVESESADVNPSELMPTHVVNMQAENSAVRSEQSVTDPEVSTETSSAKENVEKTSLLNVTDDANIFADKEKVNLGTNMSKSLVDGFVGKTRLHGVTEDRKFKDAEQESTEIKRTSKTEEVKHTDSTSDMKIVQDQTVDSSKYEDSSKEVTEDKNCESQSLESVEKSTNVNEENGSKGKELAKTVTGDEIIKDQPESIEKVQKYIDQPSNEETELRSSIEIESIETEQKIINSKSNSFKPTETDLLKTNTETLKSTVEKTNKKLETFSNKETIKENEIQTETEVVNNETESSKLNVKSVCKTFTDTKSIATVQEKIFEPSKPEAAEPMDTELLETTSQTLKSDSTVENLNKILDVSPSESNKETIEENKIAIEQLKAKLVDNEAESWKHKDETKHKTNMDSESIATVQEEIIASSKQKAAEPMDTDFLETTSKILKSDSTVEKLNNMLDVSPSDSNKETIKENKIQIEENETIVDNNETDCSEHKVEGGIKTTSRTENIATVHEEIIAPSKPKHAEPMDTDILETSSKTLKLNTTVEKPNKSLEMSPPNKETIEKNKLHVEEIKTSVNDNEIKNPEHQVNNIDTKSNIPSTTTVHKSDTTLPVDVDSDNTIPKISSSLEQIRESSKKHESPKRKVAPRARRDPVVPGAPLSLSKLYYLDSETSFTGFFPEYYDSTIYMYRGYWNYVQEEFSSIPCRPLPKYKTTFYLNYTPALAQPIVQTSSGRVVKKKDFTPSVPSSHQLSKKDHLQNSTKKEVALSKKEPVKKESKKETKDHSRSRYRIPLEKFGWKREVVFRKNSTGSNGITADIYYYSPAGKKLRSIREIIDTLPENDELKPFHFTFVRERLGFESPLEISREAVSRTLTNSDESTPKRSKTVAVNRKVFFDKSSSHLRSSGKTKSETIRAVSITSKIRKHWASPNTGYGGLKRTHDDVEDEDEEDSPPTSNKTPSPPTKTTNSTKASNGDLSKSEHLKSSVKSNASPHVKVKSSEDVNQKKFTNPDITGKKSSGDLKKSHTSQSENKVPNDVVSKHKSSESMGAPNSKKRKIEEKSPTKPVEKKLGEKPVVKSLPAVLKPVHLPAPPVIRQVVHSNKNLVNEVSNQFNAIVYLCRYLRVEDLLRVARVNRMFNAAAHSHQLWQVVKLKNSKVRDWTGLADCLTRHGTHTLDMLKMIGSADPDENDEIWNRFYKVIGKIHSLKRLELGRVTAAEILNAASNCSKNLTEFSVIAQKLATIDLKLFQGLPNLEILQLRSFESKREHGLIMMNIPMLAQMRNLRHLSLTGVKNLKSYQVTVFKDFPPLDSLELGDCTKLDERFPECSLAHMTSLVRLRLEMVQGNMANKFVETIATLPRLRTLELINIDTKKGFDEVFGRLSRVEHLLIFPTYITQSSTTNWLVLSGLARLKHSLKFLTWGLTQELLRVTTLFIEQWNAQLNLDDGVSKLDPEELKKTIVESNSIPVMKPLPERFECVHSSTGKGEGTMGKQNISELDILPIDELKAMLEKVLCDTKIKLITVPVSSTTRIYLPSN